MHDGVHAHFFEKKPMQQLHNTFCKANEPQDQYHHTFRASGNVW